MQKIIYYFVNLVESLGWEGCGVIFVALFMMSNSIFKSGRKSLAEEIREMQIKRMYGD